MKNTAKTEHNKIEQDFFDAIERIKASKPKNTDLQKLAKQGKLRLNILNVSKEAGHLRTLIGHDKCEYPNVRKALLVPNSNKEQTQVAKIASLKEEVLDLKRKLQAALDQNAILLAKRLTS